MEVEYVLKPEDLAAFSKYHAAHPSKPERRARALVQWTGVLVGLLLVGGAWLLQEFRLVPLLYSLLCPLVGFALITLAASLGACLIGKWQLKRRAPNALGWRRLALGADGLLFAGEVSKHEMKWAAIGRIVRASAHAFIYFTDAHAIILPRRPFASDEEFEQFVAAARLYRDGAREATGHAGRAPREPDTNITTEERPDCRGATARSPESRG